MAKPAHAFAGAVSVAFGVLAWLQMPAVCGFMLSSTLVGADNYIYSIWLGVLLAAIGFASGLGPLLEGSLQPLVVAGAAASAGFLACAALAHEPYASACRAVYTALTPP